MIGVLCLAVAVSYLIVALALRTLEAERAEHRETMALLERLDSEVP